MAVNGQSRPRGVTSQRLVGAIGDSDIHVVTPGFDHSYNQANFYFRKAVWNSQYSVWEEHYDGMPINPETQTVHDVLVIE